MGGGRGQPFRRAIAWASVLATLWLIAPVPCTAQPASRDAEAIPLGIAPRPDAIQPTAQATGSAPVSGVGRTLLALGGVVGLILAIGAGLRAIARRHGGLAQALGAAGRAPSGVIEVLARYPLGGGLTLVLIKLDRRVLLLSQGAGRALRGGASMTTLCELSQPEDVASILMRVRDREGDSLAARFQSILANEGRAFDESAHATPETTVRRQAHPKETAGVARGGAGARPAVGVVRRLTPASGVNSMRARLGALRAPSPGELTG